MNNIVLLFSHLARQELISRSNELPFAGENQVDGQIYPENEYMLGPLYMDTV